MAGPAAAPRGLLGRPFLWLLFALLMLAVPFASWLLRAGMSWNEIHPTVNAALNGTSAVFLVAGYIAFRRGDVSLHRSCMIAAVSASTVFLASYLARYAMTGTHRYPGEGLDKVLYLVVLFSHMVLAALVVPMVLRALYLARHKRFEQHRRVTRWLWPIWMYVSLTGVLVYVMLYHLA